MFGKPVGKLGAVGGRTLIQRAIAVLRRYGTNAHIYLPGVGMMSGLTAANYLDSAGTTQGTVDQPVGLVLDAAGGLGVELVTNGGFDTDATWIKAAGWTIASGTGVATAASGASIYQNVLTVGKTYKLTFTVVSISGGGVIPFLGGGNLGSQVLTAGDHTYIGPCVSNGNAGLSTAAGTTCVVDNISVREVTGIHATQATTANKGVLKLTNGKYNWVFDATDLLTATYPTGNESVTVIDAISTGHVTTTGVNVVGAYSMGPSVTLYGRMIVKGALTPSELALLQGFANRLAGL